MNLSSPSSGDSLEQETCCSRTCWPRGPPCLHTSFNMPLLCQQTWPVSNLAQPGENVAGPAPQVNAVKQREYQILESLREIKFNAQSIAWTPPRHAFPRASLHHDQKGFCGVACCGRFQGKGFLLPLMQLYCSNMCSLNVIPHVRG